jgi:hypothetical protein
MSLSVLTRSFISASALALAACASSPAIPTANTTVSNRAQNSGEKQYGSEACRAAAVEVIPANSFWGRSNYRQQYSVFSRAFRSSPIIQEKYSVTSENGQSYVLASSKTESHLFAMAGAAGGVLAVGPNDRGRRDSSITNAAKIALGGVLGAGLGSIADDVVNGNTRAAFDRCRLDVAEGAYDVSSRQPATEIYQNNGGRQDRRNPQPFIR